VRSPFLASFLKFHFPKNSFTSSGVDANESDLVNELPARIAREWGFSFHFEKPRKTIDSENTLFYPVDDYVETKLKGLGIEKKLISQFSIHSTLPYPKPIDPIFLSEREFIGELAKLLSFSIECMNDFLPIVKFNEIVTIKVDGRTNSEFALEKVITQYHDQGYILINTCFNDPLIQSLIERSFPVGDFFTYDSTSAIYGSNYEVLTPGKLLCSPKWRSWIFELSAQKPIVILSPPFRNSEGDLIPESFLSDIWSSRRNVEFC